MMLSGSQIDSVLDSVGSAQSTLVGAITITSPLHSAIANVLPLPRTPPPLSLDDIDARLNDLALPPELLQKAQPLLANAGFVVERATARGLYDLRERPYTSAVRQDVRLALLNVPPELFDLPKIWGSFESYIDAIDGHLKLVAQGRSVHSPGFSRVLKRANQTEPRRLSFVAWDWINSLDGDTIDQVFDLPAVPARPGGLQLGNLTTDDRARIVELLTNLASPPGAALQPRQILDNYMAAAAWPNEFKTWIAWTNQPRSDAQSLVGFAIEKKKFAPGEARPDDTYLGALLQVALQDLGLDERRELARLILHYGLVVRAEKVSEIRAYLQ